jgi:hypothetical protein
MFFNVILSPGPSKPDGRQIRSGPVCYLEQSACQHVPDPPESMGVSSATAGTDVSKGTCGQDKIETISD